MQTHRTCRVCRETKPIAEFSARTRSKTGNDRRMECRACQRSQLKHLKSTTPQHPPTPEQRREGLLRRRGLTSESYAALLASQGGGCAICGKTDSKDGRSLAVDHCHVAGHVRGILCASCNMGLGYFADDPSRLLSARAYLLRDQPTPTPSVEALF